MTRSVRKRRVVTLTAPIGAVLVYIKYDVGIYQQSGKVDVMKGKCKEAKYVLQYIHFIGGYLIMY